MSGASLHPLRPAARWPAALPAPVPRAGERSARAPWTPFDLAAFALFALLAAAAALTLRDYGLSNDEWVQHHYGELIVAYYRSGFTDRALFDFQNLYLYGGLFDIVAVLLAKLLPVDLYLLRHALCAAAGIGGVVAAWATARLVAGPRAGLIAALMLAAVPPWYGAMFNHTKDVTFAAAMLGATYFLLRLGRGLPRPSVRDTLGFGLLLGAACGLRATGLLLVGYLGLVALTRAAALREPRAALRFLASSALAVAPGLALGYAIMLAAWPWASLAPLNPVRAIFAFAHFNYQISTVLAGKVYGMAAVPRFYVPAYLAIKLPLSLLAGALVAAGFALVRHVPLRTRGELALLAFMVVFPVACEVVGHGPAFTGMRHFFFVVPPLAVLAGLGFDAALDWTGARARLLVGATLAAALAWQAALIVRLHPHQHLYYNALVGGLAGADGRYAMDYWVNIMPEAVARLKTYLDTRRDIVPGRVYTVGVCGERFSFEHERDARMQWTGGWYEADFFIAPTHMGCDRATNGRVIARIERLGVLVGVVKDRRGFPAPPARAGR